MVTIVTTLVMEFKDTLPDEDTEAIITAVETAIRNRLMGQDFLPDHILIENWFTAVAKV